MYIVMYIFIMFTRNKQKFKQFKKEVGITVKSKETSS